MPPIGKGVSRLEKKAPDLIGAGSKFKHEWLVGWLAGKEQPLYAKSIGGSCLTPQTHMPGLTPEAEEIANIPTTNF
ncbi:MAG: hypothetical protein IPM88_12210 [Nitrospira sp.]|nr:hypothetical protein [Nitrospira sp.]